MKRLLKYICRDNEKAGYIHPAMKILPPFYWELFSYLFALAIVVTNVKGKSFNSK
jgi:hypothetical protein